MFLPGNIEKEQQEAQNRREAFEKIEEWGKQLTPESIRNEIHFAVQEVQCGDPNCSPIDTAITIVFDSGGRGMIGLPMEAREVTLEELQHAFPTPEVLHAWHQGKDADWPPLDRPALRFELGTKVLCRIGPDIEKGWAPGTITQLWYREARWPPNSWAPYKIHLDDGRDIFAPGDLDQVIKRNPAYSNGGIAEVIPEEVAE